MQNEIDSRPTEEIIDKAEVARRLGKTTRTVELWTQKKLIPCAKIGRSVLFNWPDVVRAIRSHYNTEIS